MKTSEHNKLNRNCKELTTLQVLELQLESYGKNRVNSKLLKKLKLK